MKIRLPNCVWNRAPLPRYWSNRELRKIAPLFSGDIVNVSAGEDNDKEGRFYEEYFTRRNQYFLTNYGPGLVKGYQGRANELLLDLTQDLAPDLVERFDVAFNHTTLEHIFEVRVAFRNLCALTRDVLIVVVPFVQEQHEVEGGYLDHWRFTPTVLRAMYAENGLEVIYEAVSPYEDTATYLFFVGAKHSEAWLPKMPPYTRLDNIAHWVGRNHYLLHLPSMVGRCFRRRFMAG